jgi:DNA-binding transcriptional LysR family regulator
MHWSDRVGRRVKLRDMHILLAVAKSGSMGRAAVELAMSQPAVSKAISDLEHALGLRLLDRSPQGVEPTLYGDALLRCGTAVFDELKQGVKELQFLTNPTVGELSIGCTEPAAGGFVAAVVDQFLREYPMVLFNVVTADPATLHRRELAQRDTAGPRPRVAVSRGLGCNHRTTWRAGRTACREPVNETKFRKAGPGPRANRR